MRLLITEVTEMHGGNFCVAGWRAATQTMVRPLPNGANWTQGLLNQHGVAPGATLDIQASGASPNGAYPHLTEDTPVALASITTVAAGPASWIGPGAPLVAASIEDAFQGSVQFNSIWHGVRQGVSVLVGAQTRSLWAVSVPRVNLTFLEEFNKLKVSLDDGLATFKLAVSSKAIRDAWRKGGLAGVASALPGHGQVHVRLGLARAFGSPADKCYMMVNGVQW